MSFLNYTLIKMGYGVEDCIGGEKITIVDGIGCQIEGFKGVTGISPEKITVKTAKNAITVEGQNLNVASISSDEILIVGHIDAATRQKI